MIRTENGFRLSTGRDVYANHGLISIARTHDHPYGNAGDEWEIGQGYDGHIYIDDPGGDHEPPWTEAERAELADYMIAQWQAFKSVMT